MDFEFRQPPFLLVPWTSTAQGFLMETAIVRAWERLQAEDLYEIVFYENPGMSLAQFTGFFSRENVLVQLCVDITDESSPELAGMVWLSDFEQLPTHRRATGSFVFFKKYQTRKWTEGFGRIALAYWFDVLDVGVLTGVTPEPNRAARMYSKRMGIEYVARIPDYSSFSGEQCAVLIAQLTKEHYNRRYKVPAIAQSA